MNQQDTQNLNRLAEALNQLSQHRFVKIHDSTLRLVWFQFLRGLAFGFGTVVGASLMVSVAVYVLSQVEFIPLIGGYATQIIQEIDTAREAAQ